MQQQVLLKICYIFRVAKLTSNKMEKKFDKLNSMRKSHQMKASIASKCHANRDSDKENKEQYSIDIELSDNHKQVLEAFKKSSGFYNLSPKKQKSVSPQKKQLQKINLSTIAQQQQCQRIYLFGNKQGDYFTKPAHLQTKIPSEINSSQANPITLTKQSILPQTISTVSTLSQYGSTSAINNRHIDFIKQVFQTLGIISGNDTKLQMPYLIETAYTKFVDMKCNGRWDLIQKYFKGGQEDDLTYSLVTNRSIIKKKSMIETQNAQKRKVKVIQPQTSSQLARTKQKLALDLQNQIKILTKGFTFQKYCYNTEKIEQVNIYFSYDLKFIACQPKDKLPSVQSMQNYNGVTDGSRSKNFQKYQIKKYLIDEQLAFSLIFKNRTFDLVANNQQQKQQFIEGIKFARTFI